MLNIESELRSLRNELEDRNKMFRQTPNSSSPNKLKEFSASNDNTTESAQNSPCQRNVGNEEAETKSPRESSLITQKYSPASPNSQDSNDKVKRI